MSTVCAAQASSIVMPEHTEVMYQAIAQGVMVDRNDVKGARAAALDFIGFLPWIAQLVNEDLVVKERQEAHNLTTK